MSKRVCTVLLQWRSLRSLSIDSKASAGDDDLPLAQSLSQSLQSLAFSPPPPPPVRVCRYCHDVVDMVGSQLTIIHGRSDRPPTSRIHSAATELLRLHESAVARCTQRPLARTCLVHVRIRIHIHIRIVRPRALEGARDRIPIASRAHQERCGRVRPNGRPAPHKAAHSECWFVCGRDR